MPAHYAQAAERIAAELAESIGIEDVERLRQLLMDKPFEEWQAFVVGNDWILTKFVDAAPAARRKLPEWNLENEDTRLGLRLAAVQYCMAAGAFYRLMDDPKVFPAGRYRSRISEAGIVLRLPGAALRYWPYPAPDPFE